MTTETKQAPAIGATIEGNILELRFASGAFLSLNASTLSDAIARQAMMHGLKQKLVDAAAMSRNPETGRAATIDDKYDAVREVYDRLLSGEWNKAREGQSTGGLLLLALVRLYDGAKDRATIETFLAGKNDKEKAALRKNPKVAAIIAEIQAERAGADAIDSDAMLGELDD